MNIDDWDEVNGVEVEGFVPNGDLHIAYACRWQIEYLRSVQAGPTLTAWAAWVPRDPFLEYFWVKAGEPGETTAALDAMDLFETMIECN